MLRRLFCILFPLLILSVGISVSAGETPLSFPVDKSNIQILPQRFEYHLMDANRFQVGNMLIQATDIGIRLQASQGSKPKFIFFWPLDLLDSGEVVIKDSSGKALWQKEISKSQVKIKKSASGTRLATVEHDSDDQELLQKIQRSAFFQFCAHRESPQTKIYFCSKDLYLVKKINSFSILSRDSLRPESFIEINGNMVGPQGFIYLNSSRDPLFLRALMLSGSTIEIDTRMKDIRFQDVVLSEDEKKIIVSAQNKEANDEANTDPPTWTVSLDVERPFLYLKGQGNIPLRQEFVIEGPVRKENVKVFVTSSAPTNVASSELSLDLNAAESLSLEAADKYSSLEKEGGGNYLWTLKSLRRNENNRRLLKVTDNKKNPPETYLAAYDVERNSGFEAMLHLYAPLRADAQLSWIAHSHFLLTARYDAQLVKNSVYNNSSFLSLEALYKIPAGMHMKDPGYAVGLFTDSFSSSVGNFMDYGAILTAQFKDSKIFGHKIPWNFWTARLPLASADSNYKIGGSFELQSSLRFPENLDRFHEFGVKYRSFNYEKDSVQTKLGEIYGFYGFGILF